VCSGIVRAILGPKVMPPHEAFKRWADPFGHSCFVWLLLCEPCNTLLNLFLDCLQEGIGVGRRRKRLDRETVCKSFCGAMSDTPRVAAFSLK